MIKVYIVDDHLLVRTGVKRILDDYRGITVVGEAATGEEAVKWCKEHQCDIVLMDMNLPGIDGIEATKQIRSLDRVDAKYIYIIAMTANAYIEDKQAVLEAGMNEHISKPIDFNHLYNLLLNRK